MRNWQKCDISIRSVFIGEIREEFRTAYLVGIGIDNCTIGVMNNQDNFDKEHHVIDNNVMLYYGSSVLVEVKVCDNRLMNVLFLTLTSFESILERNIYSDLLREFVRNGHHV